MSLGVGRPACEFQLLLPRHETCLMSCKVVSLKVKIKLNGMMIFILLSCVLN